jgi:hypothetical protein
MGMVKCMPHPLNPFETAHGMHCTLRWVGLKSLSEYGEKVKPRDGNAVVVHTVEFTTPKKLHCLKRVMIFQMLYSIIIRPSNNYSILNYRLRY